MIALIKDNAIWYGPAPYNVETITRKLYELGYTRQAGQLTDPDGVACALPTETAIPALLDGCAMLPVVDVAEEAPAGKVDGGGRALTVTSDAVERRVVWVDAPVVVPVRTMTKYTFFKRFTAAELVAAAARGAGGDINLRVARTLLDAASDIDLDDQNIQNYVGYLVSVGDLTPTRAAEILA